MVVVRLYLIPYGYRGNRTFTLNEIKKRKNYAGSESHSPH